MTERNPVPTAAAVRRGILGGYHTQHDVIALRAYAQRILEAARGAVENEYRHYPEGSVGRTAMANLLTALSEILPPEDREATP